MAFNSLKIVRTDPEIEEEIASLEFAKKFVPVETVWGDSNLENIDAAIRALRDRGSFKMIAERQWNAREIDTVQEVDQWLEALTDESPSEGWAVYVIEAHPEFNVSVA